MDKRSPRDFTMLISQLALVILNSHGIQKSISIESVDDDRRQIWLYSQDTHGAIAYTRTDNTKKLLTEHQFSFVKLADAHSTD